MTRTWSPTASPGQSYLINRMKIVEYKLYKPYLYEWVAESSSSTVLTISDHDRLNRVSSWHLEFVISIKFVIAFQMDWICMYYHKAPKLNMGKHKQIIVPMSMRLGRVRPMLTWPYSALQWESVTAAAGQHDPSLATVNSQSMLSRSDTRTRVHQSVFSYPLTQPSLNKVLSSEDAATWW